MEEYVVETPKFICKVTLSEGIVIQSEQSCKWAIGKSDSHLWKWLGRTFGTGWKKYKQENLSL